MRLASLLLFALLTACPGAPDPTETPSPAALYGPENGWRYATEDIVPTDQGTLGFRPGELFEDLAFVDQFGDDVLLRQFTGRLVVIDIVALWCGPCVDAGPDVEAFWARQGDDGVMVLTLILDGRAPYETPDAGMSDAWVEAMGATHPVLRVADEEQRAAMDALVGAFPTALVLDHTQRVLGRFDAVPFTELDNAAGGYPGRSEACSGGVDDDLDFTTDCADSDCAGSAECVPDAEIVETIEPCTAMLSRYDLIRVDAAGPVRLVMDTVDPATAFETLVRSLPDADSGPRDGPTVGDDELPCTERVEQFGCAYTELPAGTHWLAVGAGGGGYDEDGDCVDAARGDYVLRIWGDATATLIDDDAEGPEPDPSQTEPNETWESAEPGTYGSRGLIFNGEGPWPLAQVVCETTASGWSLTADKVGSDYRGRLHIEMAAEPEPGRYWQPYGTYPGPWEAALYSTNDVVPGRFNELFSGALDVTEEGGRLRLRGVALGIGDGDSSIFEEAHLDVTCP